MATTTINTCECGRRRNKHASKCTQCHKLMFEQATTKAKAIVQNGKCPDCGCGLRRNSTIAGWWQCEQFGAEGFRKDSAKPPCSFQCFTE